MNYVTQGLSVSRLCCGFGNRLSGYIHSVAVQNTTTDVFFPPPEDGVGLVPKRGCLLTLAYYAFPRWYEFGERRWNDILTEENRRTRRKTCSSATLSTTSLTWIDLGANPGLRGEGPATNDLSHGTADVCYAVRTSALETRVCFLHMVKTKRPRRGERAWYTLSILIAHTSEGCQVTCWMEHSYLCSVRHFGTLRQLRVSVRLLSQLRRKWLWSDAWNLLCPFGSQKWFLGYCQILCR
jgi:hypothetical protein